MSLKVLSRAEVSTCLPSGDTTQAVILHPSSCTSANSFIQSAPLMSQNRSLASKWLEHRNTSSLYSDIDVQPLEPYIVRIQNPCVKSHTCIVAILQGNRSLLHS